MINYAHRGASEYAPENTMSSFYLGLLQGANGIETDVQRTKDGVLVLFHDDTVGRVSDGTGRVCDLTLAEMRRLRISGNVTTGFYDRVVTLREFLSAFAAYDISFAIELKGAGVEEETLQMVREFGILGKCTFTSFQLDYIRKIKQLEPQARVGWLVREADAATVETLRSIGGEEIAPFAGNIDEESLAAWRGLGLGVRAWGVGSVATMKHMCRLGVDGMTVNFPDRLFRYLAVVPGVGKDTQEERKA